MEQIQTAVCSREVEELNKNDFGLSGAEEICYWKVETGIMMRLTCLGSIQHRIHAE